MDNVSHSLAGAALACGVLELPPARKVASAGFRRALFLTSFFANNLPDVDSAVFYFIRPGHLGNLLNHRGYTHTVVFAPLGAAISVGLAWLFFRKKWKQQWNLPAFLVGVLGILLHLFMDYWNDYGVHPFWPFSNRWFYGDLLNVIEPLFWFSLLPFAWELSRKSKFRYVVIALGILMLGLSWIAPYTRGAVAVGITLWAVFAFWFQSRVRGLGPALAMAGLVVGTSAVGSGIVHSRLAQMYEGEKLLQMISAPAAGNPLCWRVIVVSERGQNYSMRLGTMSLYPELVRPSTCWYGVFGPHNLPLAPVKESTPADVAWVGEFLRPMSEFKSLRERSCEFEQILRFTRAPFWQESEEGMLIGDLRYDRGVKKGFAELYLNSADGCLRVVPPWEPPVHIPQGN